MEDSILTLEIRLTSTIICSRPTTFKAEEVIIRKECTEEDQTTKFKRLSSLTISNFKIILNKIKTHSIQIKQLSQVLQLLLVQQAKIKALIQIRLR